MRVLLKAPVTPYSGYGQDGIALAQCLINWGCDVYLQPTTVDGPIPLEVLKLLTKHLEAPFDLIIVHVDPERLEATPGMKESSTMTIGWTMWEYTNLGPLFAKWKDIPEEYRSRNAVTPENMQSRLDTFDVLVAYDENSNQALSQYATVPVVTVQGGYSPAEWGYVKRNWDAPVFRFAMQGALHSRKGAMLAIDAFKELRDEHGEDFNAELHMKSVPGTGLHPQMETWCPGLKIHYGVWRHVDLVKFYAEMHCLLAPSRGEGKNLPALQFLSTGGPVIATNWGGHTQWLSDSYAYLLDYELEEDPRTGAASAAASKGHLKELMLHVYRNRSEAAAKGEIAARTIPLMCSWERAFERVLDHLPRVHPRGTEVRDAAIACRQERDDEHLFERKKALLGRV